MSRTIRKAIASDMDAIMQVMDAAKKIMRQSGNMSQWGDGYPSEAVITADMEKSGGFVIVEDGGIVGYFAFLPSPEPTYDKIYMDFCFLHDSNIRIDTHRDNTIMQHVIMKYGFTYCGIIYLLSGDERLAYQKMKNKR